MFRFDQFELDPQTARLRGRDGELVRLRPKSFETLCFLAANVGRPVSKQELMTAVWPNVHVNEDSIFQCIREIRAALGDERRELIKLVSGRGYLLDATAAETCLEPTLASRPPASDAGLADPTAVSAAVLPPPEISPLAPVPAMRRWPNQTGWIALAVVTVIGAIIGIAATTTPLLSSGLFAPAIPTVAVKPMTPIGDNIETTAMAARVTEMLSDGLANLSHIRVLAPPLQSARASFQLSPAPADLVVSSELEKDGDVWRIKTRLSNGDSGEVRWTQSADVAIAGVEPAMQLSRLTAAIGDPLTQRINAIINFGTMHQANSNELPSANAKVAIEQASAAINRTSLERFRAAQTILEKAVAENPDSVDLKAALAAHLIRGIQLVWYDPVQVPAIEASAQEILEQALRQKPTYLPVLEGYCRLLTGTNQFVEGTVACSRALSFNPWSGQALYNLGLSQMQLGYFNEALTTFNKAYSFDTPKVARWTWMLGAGVVCLLMDRNDEAVTWLTRSIAVTPATGRSHAMLAAAYQRLGRNDEAKEAIAKTLELRPGTDTQNVRLPLKNQSTLYRDASRRIVQSLREAGLPEGDGAEE